MPSCFTWSAPYYPANDWLMSMLTWLRNKLKAITPPLSQTFSSDGYTISIYELNDAGEFSDIAISVICAAYNAERTISRMIQSVFDQTIQAPVELIIIDDHSSDRTAEIVLGLQNPSIPVRLGILETNTGTPATPRNIGISMAKGKYLFFLDSDDWLHPQGLQALYDIMEETGDDFVEGRTIKVTCAGTSIIGEFVSYAERRSLSPFEIERLFYYMGPTSRLVRADLVRKHSIKFPPMKFAEDKSFYYHVFAVAERASTTTQIIQYVDRTDENSNSLTRSLDIIAKRRCDLSVIEEIQEMHLPAEKEAAFLNRIYEYDFLRSFNTLAFVRSRQRGSFFDVFSDAYETTKDLEYDFADNLVEPIYRLAIKLYRREETEKFIQLFEWSKLEVNKKHCIRGGTAFWELPFLEGEERYLEIPLFANVKTMECSDNTFHCLFEMYGQQARTAEYVLIRDRVNSENELRLPIQREDQDGLFSFFVSREQLSALASSRFTIFIRYSGWRLAAVRKFDRVQIQIERRVAEFYPSQSNCLALSIP